MLEDILEAFTKANEETITKFEKASNISLSEDYRNFLLEYNGGDFVENIYIEGFNIAISEKVAFEIKRLYGLVSDDETYSTKNLKKINDLIKDGIVDWPSNFLIIGSISNGHDYISISIDSNTKGSVYVISDEMPEMRIKISDTFSQFLDIIKKYDV
ncbi:MAG: SMI1/KNR4 family protein [Chloroflexota bacterium]